MSLFKAREWWATNVGEEEEFDIGCLCTANIDNKPDGLDKIIVGSYHGFLRIYNPCPVKTEKGWSGMKAEDVICETHLQYPVLQVEAGRFVAASEGVHLAILHPRKLAVYSLVGSAGAVEHGTHYQLKLQYEHNLQRTSCNFCFGPFGGVKAKDFICVQSMDGTLSVFEQESFAFSRFLPGALLPGPLKYVSKTDSFITVSSARQLESYKYQVLAVATDTKTKEESQSLKSGKRVAHDWTFNLGEQAMDLVVVTAANAPPAIYVLGERSLFMLSEVGKLKFIKKLVYSPSAFLPYASVSEGTMNCAVATHTNTLMVYQDITLQWAAQLTHIPVQVKVANFRDLQGVVVTLDEVGHLTCCYMGTDPAMFRPPSVELRELDYGELDYEMRELQKIIKEKQATSFAPLPVASSDEDLHIQIHVPPNLDQPSLACDLEYQDEDAVPSITVKISLKARVHLTDVKVNIHASSPLGVNETLIPFPSLEPSRPGETQVTFYKKSNTIPGDLRGEVTANYLSPSGAPRVVHAGIRLPLKLVTKPCMPVKTSQYKVTVDTNQPPTNLNDLFPDLLGENASGPGNALGFQYYGCEHVVTMLASKTSQRYRLQSDDFSCMWLMLSEVISRLENHFRSIKDFRISYDGPLPLQEYFEVLDRHFDARQNDERLKSVLEERACQFRAIQRRLLTRFKDKTPSPLANLDTLLDGTYRQILAIAEAVEDNRQLQSSTAISLGCSTHIINTLIRLWQNMSPDEFAVLEASLSPSVSQNGSQGWEETVDAAITHLLRTCLAKSTKDQTVNPSPLGILKDTTKLKKHIALVCDRLSKGAHLAVEGQMTTAPPSERARSTPHKGVSVRNPAPKTHQRPISTTLDDHDATSLSGNLGDAEVPMGSKFGEKKKSPRQASKKKKGLPSMQNGGALPPLGGGVALPSPLGVGLPPLGGSLPDEGGTLNMSSLPPFSDDSQKYRKKKETAVDTIPDLDELDMPDPDTATIVNGGNELVYGL